MRYTDPRGLRVVNLPIKAAAKPTTLKICGVSEAFSIEAAATESEGKKLRKFSMVAYTGVAMSVGFGLQVVVDLEGMKVPSQSRPILKDHETTQIVGHTTTVEVAGESIKKLKVAGVISGVGDAAKEVLALADNEFPWQASIGTSIDSELEFIAKGETVKVNGRNFSGPVYVARNTTLGEVSFVPIGADHNTSANVAAGANREGAKMNDLLKAWLQAKGIDAATVAEPMVPIFQASYDAEVAAKAADNKNSGAKDPPANKHVRTRDDDDKEAKDRLKAQREADAIEADRVSGIRKILAAGSFEIETEAEGKKINVDILAHAIREGWPAKEVAREKELHDLRASRPTGQSPFGYVAGGKPDASNEILQAAFSRSLNLPNVEKTHKPEVMEAADKHYRNMGLQQLILTCAASNGYGLRAGERITAGNIRSVLQSAFLQASGFSSLSLPGILGNVANKAIESGYVQEDSPWRRIAKVASVSNFHSHTVYRMLDDMEYEKLGSGGEIAHGKVDSESYTRQVDTFARMFALTRKSIINDDLGAFDDLQTRIGRGGAKKFRKVFWTEFLSDASNFWTSARTNYITGATTTLLVDGVGLGLGVKAFRQMTSPTADGTKRIGGTPKLLVVPPELEVAARVLWQYTGQGAAVGTAGNVNTWAQMFEPIAVAELSDSGYTGYSTTAWYLLRDPSDMATVVVSFLNGNEMPTVESADADFNTLGIQFRGYHDFGVDQAEYLAGIKSKGAA